MSHNNSDQTLLSQPLKVETDENHSVHHHNIDSSPSNYYGDEEKDNFSPRSNDIDSLGPLPSKWEKAYTESGEVYFIDHSTGTSHWLDPRLSKFQKKLLEDCLDDELPYGWEKICDPNYGTYFIDHVNRRTQYENPVIQAKHAARISRTSFTKDPMELCGQKFRTSLVKSSRGLGFTIVGGDDSVDEFLQIKSVVPKGPAWLDGQLQTGDVIVYVNDTCVLGYTHIQIVRLFQSINVGSTVSLEVCRGYPLPFDPNDPNTEVVTTIAVDSHLQQISLNDKRLDTNYNFLEEEEVEGEVEREDNDNTPDIDELIKNCTIGGGGITNNSINNNNNNKDTTCVRIVKGNLGFGFTIADSACGQRVKQILDRQRCKNLMEGDILLEINDTRLGNLSHDEVVQVLKNCAYNSEATISVQRGSTNNNSTNTTTKTNAPNNIRLNKLRKLDNTARFACNIVSGSKDSNMSVYRSKTPTADIYSTQPREVLPSRPKTPLVDTRNLSKTPVKDLNVHSNNSVNDSLYSTGNEFSGDRARLRLSLIDNPEGGDEEDMNNIDKNDISNNAAINNCNNGSKHSYDDYHQPQPPPVVADSKYEWGAIMPHLQSPQPHPYDCGCFACAPPSGDIYDYGVMTMANKSQPQWQYVARNAEYVTNTVVLQRQDTGFGFRIVGGIEDKSQVAVGHIVTGGAADMDGRIKSGDEIVSVDGFSVLKASHRQVVRLMNAAAAARGQVTLVLRRRIYLQQQQHHHLPLPRRQSPFVSASPFVGMGVSWPPPHDAQMLQSDANNYDVTVQRNESEGFGFVIISSANKQGSTIGRLIEDSPAERCGRLRVGDHIVAVNNIAIMHLSHGDIVNLIKESGLSVTLTIAPDL